ncbi:hypothetical protein FRC12_020682, partial [Ceratobasidium sp. 428]
MNGIARRLLGGGLGSSSKDTTPAPTPTPPPTNEPPPPQVAPLAIGGGKSGSGSWPTPASMLASARSMTGRSEDATPTAVNQPGGVVDDSTIRQRPTRTSSMKGSASV